MKSKILAIEKLRETSAEGYADMGGDMYVRFFVHKDQVQIEPEYDKQEYGDHRRFAAVMGKWDPYVKFFIKPSHIKKFDARAIMAVAERRG